MNPDQKNNDLPSIAVPELNLSNSQQKIMRERRRGSGMFIFVVIAIICVVILGILYGYSISQRLLHILHTYSS
jgi:type VI protein secretion system component VasF